MIPRIMHACRMDGIRKTGTLKNISGLLNLRRVFTGTEFCFTRACKREDDIPGFPVRPVECGNEFLENFPVRDLSQ